MRKINPPRTVGRRVYVGAAGGLQVPMREISLTDPNPPVRLYDTSGPHGDPGCRIDLEQGLAPHRRDWITGREFADHLYEPLIDGTIDEKDFWQWWLRRVESSEPYPEPQRTCGGLFV